MLIKGSFMSDGLRLYPAPEHFLTFTATNGIYPLNQPLEIARINGQPVTITVGDKEKSSIPTVSGAVVVNTNLLNKKVGKLIRMTAHLVRRGQR